MATFLMAGGGTGGHVVPALAVARELQARGHEPFFIGTQHGFEARLVPTQGFPIEWISIGGLKNVGFAKRLRTLWQLPASIIKSLGIIRSRKPAALFSMGGYVAAPPMLAAIVAGVPMVVMEPNAMAGFTSRMMARFTKRALLTFEETKQAFPAGVCEITGLPVREEFFAIEPTAAKVPFRVLITGGSRGARTLNRATREALPLIAQSKLPIHLTVQCGADALAEMTDALKSHGVAGEAKVFIDDMPKAFADAALIVARAGAGSISELAAAGKPSILVPFPFAADDHQTKNAEAMARAGAATLVPDAAMNGERLFKEIQDALGDPERLAIMAAAARKLAKPGAARRAAAILEEVAGLTGQPKAETIVRRNVF
jgi:UDP-N-acetylglucosamine--N-acetylmuramyl-(pentapeptide) pyrophosphoryl-undecaprenol N-acetylglucosamine transferase